MLDHEREMWICIVEADGVQMQSRYYRRRDALALRVRGDMELGPLARRAGEDNSAVIFQEGCVIAASESLARQMAWLARDCFDEMEMRGELEGRHPTVSIGRIVLSDSITRTREDAQVIERIETVLGKRGRKPPTTWWVVACKECVTLNEVEDWNPVNCPHCSGFLIHMRKGRMPRFADPGGDIFEAWKRTRFAGPHWEPVPIDPDGVQPPAAVEIYGASEEATVELLAGSPALDQIRQMPRDIAFQFLDAIFIGRTYRDLELRLDARARTATEFFKRGGAPTAIRLTEPKVPDLVDAAQVLKPSAVVPWLLAK